jgi:hypothetical protein
MVGRVETVGTVEGRSRGGEVTIGVSCLGFGMVRLPWVSRLGRGPSRWARHLLCRPYSRLLPVPTAGRAAYLSAHSNLRFISGEVDG